MTNKLDNFEHLIKESFSGYEVPYNPGHWQELEKELSSGAGGASFHYFTSVATGVVITFVIIASIFLMMPGDAGQYAAKQPTEVNNDIDQPLPAGPQKSENVTAVADTVVQTAIPENSEKEAVVEKISKAKKPSAKAPAATSSTVAVTAAKKEVSAKSTLRTGCVGLTVEFKSDNTANDANFLWNFGDGYFSSSANPVHTYTRPGQFDVSLSVTSKSSGQISSNMVQGSIIIVEAPVADFRTEIIDATKLRLLNSSSNTDEAVWMINNTRFEKDQLLDLKKDNVYNITLVANNQNGCTDSLDREIIVKNTGIQLISGGSFVPAEFNESETSIFKVFDETGKNVIYESNSKTLPWIYDKREPQNNPWVLISKSTDSGTIKIYSGKISSK